MTDRDTRLRDEQPADTAHRASGVTDTLNAGDTHVVRGVGENTRVECPEHDAVFGPHPGARSTFDCCPYCGADADTLGHEAGPVEGELQCPSTAMSTYRFCPGCGTQVGE
ncbi:hypothetical protein C471_00010 [Halorubrum saccharovorum DSM 1137]|uniref:Uncharacterized protein n=1 Tax=Halorubrum saccharovorum DSM 1137 TaxID=1227484 RepID=M0E7I9_9EURY|nr:hypothetical protein C471_00010 [Halorubrum saccharovorum DSM 1137]